MSLGFIVGCFFIGVQVYQLYSTKYQERIKQDRMEKAIKLKKNLKEILEDEKFTNWLTHAAPKDQAAAEYLNDILTIDIKKQKANRKYLSLSDTLLMNDCKM
jgi:hypothetical protein